MDLTYEQNVLCRAQAGIEADRASIEPQGFIVANLLASASGVTIACASEAYSATAMFKAQWESLSDGTDLGHDMLPMRLCIVAALLLVHSFLHGNDDGASPLRRWLGQLRVVPVAALLGGMAVFGFAAISQATGGDDGQPGLAGLALGVACGALFAVSFLACNALMGKFLPTLRAFLTGWARRARVAGRTRDLAATDACRARVVGLRRDLAAKTPEALRRRTAAEAASIVARVTADVTELRTSLDALPDDLRPQDVTDGLPIGVPRTALDKLHAYLAPLDFSFFLNLLAKDA